jgi:hypothetical protein
MTGQSFWAGAGVVCFVISGVLYYLYFRQSPEARG